MTNRLLLALLAAVAVVLLTTLLVDADRGERGRSPASDATVETERGGVAPTQPGAPVEAQGEEPAEEEPAPRGETARVAAGGAGADADEAGGIRVLGRVVVPPGTPADERLFVVARGRKLADGSYHRAEVEVDGSFRALFAPDTRRGRLVLEARYLWLDESPRLDLGELDAARPVVLEPRLGGRVVGRVVLPEGHAAADLPPVRLTRPSGAFPNFATVGEDGAFALDALPPAADYWLALEAPDLEPVRRSALSVGEAETVELELVLDAGATLAGRVVDEAGEPVERASVELTSRGGGGVGGWFRRTVDSDADGAFRLAGVPGDPLDLFVHASGYRLHERELEPLGDSAARVDEVVVLERGDVVAGRVLWPDGAPAEGVRVSRRVEAGFRTIEDATETDPRGAFELWGIGEEAVRLEAEGKRRQDEASGPGAERPRSRRVTLKAAREDVAPGTRDLVLVLGAGLELHGRVRTADGPRPSWFKVTRTRVLQRTPYWSERVDESTERFDSSDGAFVLSGLTAGRWELHATAPGHAPSTTVTRELPGPSESVELVLSRAASLAGVVRGPAGAAVAGARVQSRVPHHEWTRSGPEAVAAGDGGFTLEDLPPGPVSVFASAPGFAPSAPASLELVAGEARHGVELRLRAASTITGEVLGADGQPEAGCAVRAWVPSTGHVVQGTTDARGGFRFDDLAPGEYEVSAESDGEELLARYGAGLDASSEDVLRRRERVALDEGAVRHVVLRYSDEGLTRVSGRVLAGGQPVASGRLWFWLQSENGSVPQSFGADVAADGTYSLSVPGAGEYTYSWSDPETDGLQVGGRVEVPPGPRYRLDVEFDVGSLSGRVLGPGGEPLAGFHVRAEGQHTSEDGSVASGRSGAFARATARTDADGAYTIPRLEARTYRVVATERADTWNPMRRELPRFSDATREGVVVEPGAHVSGVDLELEVGGGIAGRLIAPEGVAVGRLWVGASALDGHRLDVSAGADESGRFRLDGLPVGEVLLALHGEAWAIERTPVRVRAGERTSVEVVLHRPGRLVVTLLDARGERVRGALSVVGGEHAPCFFMPDRTWRIGPLAPGPCTLRIAVGGAERLVEVDVVAGETVERDVVFE